jgi:predicted dehydrogenase
MALRVAVAGVGRRGRDWAGQIVAANGLELVACADPDPAARTAVAAQLELPADTCHPTLSDALEATPCDAVVVASTPLRHRELCEEAISHRCATLVEKPFAPTLEDATAIVDLAEQADVPLVVGQNFRYTRANRTVGRLVRAGALGPVRMVVCQSYRVPELRDEYVPDESVTGWGAAVHQLDALRHTVGELSGVMAESFGSSGRGLSLHALLAFENGARGIYSATYESSGHEYFELGQEFYERVVGERATLHVIQRWLFLCPRGGLPRPVRRGRRPKTEEMILIEQLEHAIRTGEQPEAGGRDNLRTIAAVEACARSAEQGSWVDPRELVAASV